MMSISETENTLPRESAREPAVKGEERWLKLLGAFAGARVLVVGDMMLDRFIWGKVSRISPEAPVPVVDVERESVQPGGASNVVNNVVALGARAYMVGVVGGDDEGRQLLGELSATGVDVSGVVIAEGLPTTLKTRIVAHSQQVVRVDRERRAPLPEEVHQRLADAAAGECERVDAVIISDYDKGVLDERLVSGVVRAAARRGVPVVANPKPKNLSLLHGVTAISLNHTEAQAASGLMIPDEESLERAGRKLLEDTGARHILITMGGRGLAVFSKGAPSFRAPAVEVPVYDVAGAGDTVVSTFTLAIHAGADAHAAAELANIAAGAVVRKVGVATVDEDEILLLYRELHAAGLA